MFEGSVVPEHLYVHLQRFGRQWQSAASEECQQALTELLAGDETLRDQLAKAVIGSEFIATQATTSPEHFLFLLCRDELHLQADLDDEAVCAFLHKRIDPSDEAVFEKSLREARRDFMVRIIWRDMNRLATLEQTTGELSCFASASIQEAMDFHYSSLTASRGVPVGTESGEPQPLLVLGMGKLGARELNVSSDIDLIFTYPEGGETTGVRQSLSNQEFFIRLGQRIIRSLDAVTADGFVFRVDMRLRPYGASGALVASFDAMENYYQTQGREWERYAMIKARVVACTSDAVLEKSADASGLSMSIQQSGESHCAELMELLRPFTYRRYLDFSAIEAMRSMKLLITREVARKGLENDVKLGAGGIREVEFIVQVFQLIRGGRDPQLQERQLLRVLPMLGEAGLLPEGVPEQLGQAYRFLRDAEHGIQGFQDRQTQQLPIDPDAQQRMAWIMGFADWNSFSAQLQVHREHVSAQFTDVIADPEEKREEQIEDEDSWQLLWQGSLTDEPAQEFLASQGLDEPQQVLEALSNLRESRPVSGMQATARERLDTLMPALLADLRGVDNAVTTLQRICSVLEAVARRSAYIVLLVENPPARAQLIKLCSATPWIAQQLTAHPVLLDELLDARTLYTLPDVNTLRDDLRRDTLRLSWEDLEGQMEALRYFRMSHALRVAACEVTDILPLMKVSDYLTFLAEVILEHVLELAWQQMVARYGRPRRPDGSTYSVDSVSGDFVVVGYGKLGGIELGHGSDLDLVFVHRADTACSTEGPRELDNSTFFIRLGQKIIHILNAQTMSGQLYDIDMRLRPSGNSGLLVSSLTAFAKYQENDAWTWEHQALVRARVVAGSRSLAEEFEEVRSRILSRQRELPGLRKEVTEMREKMRKHLGTSENSDEWHIKQDAGGIVDIEFMVQYAVLAWAHSNPGLTRYTDNIRILGCLAEAGLITGADAELLIEAYKTYRSTVHRLALQGLPSTVANDQFLTERRVVADYWQRLLTGPGS
ncbi:bifunctional [glutamate--ammonia ligase]-adenylyl-L-tyrosine phosphorylase/[glutamate--ammonia-ligase] adenylyltransferase [Proteobacteria bacterium 005FR1]|nr:bifunctional [glutamate--ammonia ligase]-adenylyl-L-tyrosine phosphorylase/[glutamate--ammonia-ligase] adenylyltransferase [Proteobacteria bacterium 005FR1]